MNLVTFHKNYSTDIVAFINFWSTQYLFSNETLYSNSISKKEFTVEDIQNLYIWKNGMKLSDLKQKSLEDKIISKLSIINDLKSNNEIDLVVFSKEFKNLSAVWKIFLLHIIKPHTYPIYDQHIHRCFVFIHNEDWSNISNDTISNKDKETFYFNRYLPFIQSSNLRDLKQLDEAFFAFGQFLNTRNYATLL
ncbi:hypothetical protein GCM10008015_30790 [Flavobacterium palustre]|uniref:Uncharacterized protein n=1 Tax=Flavobacterium palustre TaxID=1476463 RepID=A0ABQ1HTN3_9FLAO|nr:hypothetical protein [Flavobacterium palustre]GGA88047.1 hypothetical protein GCM10008015_30790 [Flavobacterium palustre]